MAEITDGSLPSATVKRRSPIGVAKRYPKASGAAPELDPELPAWQEARWAGHSFEPVVGKTRRHRRADSFHGRQLKAEDEDVALPAVRPHAVDYERHALVRLAEDA